MSALRSTTAVVVMYVLHFCTTGVLLPYLPSYLKALHLTATQAGLVQSLQPLMTAVVPPLWGQLADRWGRPGRVLMLLCLGSIGGLLALLQARSWVEVLAATSVNAIFACSILPMIDAVALRHVATQGGTFAGLRRWGSLSFAVTSVVFGQLVRGVDQQVILVPLLTMAASATWCAATLARAPKVVPAGLRPSWSQAAELLRRPMVRTVMVAGALHWVAATPFHGSLGPHLSALGADSSAIGMCWAVAVASEVLVLSAWPRFASRFSPRTVLLVSMVVSAVRWLATAAADSPVVVIALATVHGICFGAFYVASVEWMTSETPESLRATGQALLFTAIFGFGGMFGYSTSGALYDLVGGHRLFTLAGLFELAPMALLLRGGARVTKA